MRSTNNMNLISKEEIENRKEYNCPYNDWDQEHIDWNYGFRAGIDFAESKLTPIIEAKNKQIEDLKDFDTWKAWKEQIEKNK